MLQQKANEAQSFLAFKFLASESWVRRPVEVGLIEQVSNRKLNVQITPIFLVVSVKGT